MRDLNAYPREHLYVMVNAKFGVEAMFTAMCECQALHPDPEDEDSDDYDGEEYDVEAHALEMQRKRQSWVKQRSGEAPSCDGNKGDECSQQVDAKLGSDLLEVQQSAVENKGADGLCDDRFGHVRVDGILAS
ncbi:hypothetical protein A6R68_12863 [Neotoma lepida]|uniref:Uncharacterized protein n=1 Tax=Neotoma lepida TaxID=56216 RepID=A0A1A6H1T5_NEOLE|nr:hypothetical protein A6R68_12863 [Neotoma lepida]